MPNILINPNSGIIEFATGVAGGSSFISTLNFTGGSSYSARLTHDNFGGLNIVSYTTGSGIAYSGVERFSIDGNNGRLFSVTDNLSGSLFSVNDIAGLPIIEAFDDNTVVMGAFNRNDFVLTGNSLGLGGLPNTGTTKLYVSGNVAITGNLNTNSGTFQSVQINKNRFLSYDYETGNFNITDYVTIVNCALTGSGDFATGVLPSGNISGFNFFVKNINACPVVITGSGNYTIDNTPNLYIYSGESVELLGVTATNLTGWYTMNTNLGAV